MDAFEQALVCPDCSPMIPEEEDWFAPLLGPYTIKKSC